MLKSTVAGKSFSQSLGAVIAGTRGFSISVPVSAVQKEGKKKVTMGYKKKDVKEKVRKGGMTHLKFRDAVRLLKFENLARDLGELGIEDLGVSTQANKVVKYSANTEKTLVELNSFKKFQHHELFKNPISLVSENTKAVDAKFVKNLAGPSKDNRLCLIGEKGVGKSTLVTQAKALAVSEYKNDVVLLHIDAAEKMVDGSNDYIYNKTTGKYQQPMYTKRLIKKLRAANEDIFKKLPLSRDTSFTAKKVEHHLKKDVNTLYDFVLLNHDFGLLGASSAFQFFVDELVHHSEKVPVLVSIDNFNALLSEPFTAYRTAAFTPIHFTGFEMGDLVLRLVSGDLSFSKGGVLVAESNDFRLNKTLPVGLGLVEYDPYYTNSECDLAVASSLLKNGGVRAFDVKNLTKSEARTLLQFWEQSGALQVRDYPTKEEFSTYDDAVLDARRPGQFVETKDPVEQFENILQSSYVVSSGNPGFLLRATNIAF